MTNQSVHLEAKLYTECQKGNTEKRKMYYTRTHIIFNLLHFYKGTGNKMQSVCAHTFHFPMMMSTVVVVVVLVVVFNKVHMGDSLMTTRSSLFGTLCLV